LPLGASYRLPTEAEREYAARAGTTTKWCCGDDAQHLGEYAWYDANSGKRMHPVGQKQPNAFGLYDMYGNVWEWCSDWYDENYYATSPGDDPQGPAAGSLRVFRGGGWINEPVFSRSAVRNHNSPSHREVLVGFRVVLAMVEAESQIVATVTPAQKPTAAPSNSPPSPAIAPFNAQQAKHHQEQWAKHLHRSVIETNSIGMKLALIPPGEFLMGSPADEEGRRNDERRRKVTITNPFFICTHEVSVAEFRRFVEATGFKTEAEVDGKGGEGREQKGGRNEWLAKPQYSWRNQGTFILSDSHPVTNVTANDASAFCDWLSRSEGRKYRLPTEEEWEFACRGGTTTPWFWGARPEGAENYAWFSVNNAGVLHPVGLKMPNPFGLYDMAGNVVEMTTTEEPATLQTRGGHFCCEVSEIGSASRWLRPERSFRIYLSGFRIISEIRESDPPREESAHKASTPPLATAIGTDASRAAGEGREEGPLPPIIGVDWPGDIDCARSAMVIGIRPRFDIRKSWGLSLEFKASNFSKGWHMIFFWGDDRFARDPIHVRMDGPVLEAGFDDATNERTQVIRVKLSTANARRWKKLLLTYDAVSRELTLSLDEKVLGKQRCGFAPSVDRPMPVIIGEVHSRAEGKPDGQPFLGRVRNVRLENGVDAN
jgi:formylglycine-generating enzyme required for sulfatase activity